MERYAIKESEIEGVEWGCVSAHGMTGEIQCRLVNLW